MHTCAPQVAVQPCPWRALGGRQYQRWCQLGCPLVGPPKSAGDNALRTTAARNRPCRATAQICPPRRTRAQSALGRRPCIAVRPTKAAGGCAASGTTTTDANARPCMAALAVLGPSRPRHAAACRHGLAALAEHAKTCIAIVAHVRRSWRGALCAPLAVPAPTAHTRVRRVSSRPVQQPLSPSARRCGFIS